MEKDKITLDNEQIEAVNCNDNNIVVIAAAGSGKTRVITERVKRLLLDGVDPTKIVCITFTNLAAEEMISRLSDVEGIEKVFIGTIHSYAFLIHGGSFSLRTTELEENLIKEILTPNAFDPTSSDLSYEKYLSFTKAKATKKTLPLLTVKELRVLENLKDKIDTVCSQRNIISFDEIVAQATEKNSRPDILHMLVDEFQDVGRNEFNFISTLAASNNFLVGDDWQSIYGFRGADPAIFQSLALETGFGFKTIRLNNNYRSVSNVVDASCEVIEDMEDYIHKDIVAVREDDGRVIEMSTDIKQFAREFIKGSNYKDWFVIARANRDVNAMIDELKSQGIPAIGFKKMGLSSEELNELIEVDAVKVLTVHISKGLESKNVAYFRSNSRHRDDETIRIHYVAMTRAKDNLYIITPPSRFQRYNW